MAGGAYAQGHVGPLHFFEEGEKVSAGSFKQMLESVLVPFFHRCGMHVGLFDNAKVHNAKMLHDVFLRHGIVRTDHPPQSPEFNPIELPWNRMAYKLQGRLQFMQHVTMAAFKQEIMRAWQVEAQLFAQDLLHVQTCMLKCHALGGGNGY